MGDATMNAKKLSIQETSQRELIKHFHRQVIGLLIVLAKTYVSFVVHSCLKLK